MHRMTALSCLSLQVLVSDKPECGACQYAQEHHIPTLQYPPSSVGGGALEPEQQSRWLVEQIQQQYKADFVILAGYLKVCITAAASVVLHDCSCVWKAAQHHAGKDRVHCYEGMCSKPEACASACLHNPGPCPHCRCSKVFMSSCYPMGMAMCADMRSSQAAGQQ